MTYEESLFTFLIKLLPFFQGRILHKQSLHKYTTVANLTKINIKLLSFEIRFYFLKSLKLKLFSYLSSCIFLNLRF